MLINFGNNEIGYLIELSVGHKDKPNEKEIE